MRTLLLYLGRVHLHILAAVLLFAPPARADVVSLIPAHDANLIEIAPDRNNGGDLWFNAGTTQNRTRNRALIQFDFSGLIPANAVILSVDLSLDVLKVPGDGFAASAFSLHPMLRSWGEGIKFSMDNPGGQGDPATVGEATWNNRFFGGATWGAPGGLAGVDFVSQSSGAAFIYGTGDSPYHFANPLMALDVQRWVADPSSNFGWMLMCDEEGTPFTARRFGSLENPNAPPVLTIEFEIVPEPGVTALCGLGMALVGAAAWRKRK